MRRAIFGAGLLVAALGAGASGGDDPASGLEARVTKALAEADPLAEGSTSELLAAYPQGKCYGDPPLPLVAIGTDASQPEVVRERALRLRVALTRLTWIENQPGAAAPSKAVMWWLALDELDRELPRGPREKLLAEAIPDPADREASLKALASGREVAARFCRDWNEIEHDEAETKKYAELRAELVKSGRAAIPYLATLLSVPPHAVFTNLHVDRGPTARQQVRALFALDFLDARECMELFVFHTRGPSFTECATARAAIRRLAKVEWPEGADEAGQVAAIDAWWSKFVTPRPDGDPRGERDHLLRHTLRWARTALESGSPDLVEWSEWGPRQLEHVVGKLAFDPDAPPKERAAQLAALERDAMKVSPTYICFR